MSDVGRSLKHGVGAGLIAGAVFALLQVIAVVAVGEPAIVAFRRLASVFAGEAALRDVPAATVMLVALIGHLWLSAAYGLFYGAYSSALTPRTRGSVGRQAVIGTLFGTIVWMIHYLVFAQYRYPWLLAQPQLVQVAIHALGFGLPLGLLYGFTEHSVYSEGSARNRHLRRA